MTTLIYTVLFLMLPSGSDTQGPPAPERDGDPEGPQLPIDDNIWILIVAGILFGIYIIYKRNQAINKAA